MDSQSWSNLRVFKLDIYYDKVLQSCQEESSLMIAYLVSASDKKHEPASIDLLSSAIIQILGPAYWHLYTAM